MKRIEKVIQGYHYVGFMLVIGVIMVVVFFGGDDSGIRFNIGKETSMVEDYWFKDCDFFNGRWVYDNRSRPLYKEKECSFMMDNYSCEKLGRKDFKYQSWRWQPHGCELPRFNGTALLEKLRDKRVVFVGDSLGQNHWVSFLCLIDSWILEPSHKVVEWHGPLIKFRASEYNVSIDFYWEPFLVESNCDDPINHKILDRVVKIEGIERHAKQWINADMLIFDSYRWWLDVDITLVWGSFENPNKTIVESRRVVPYEMALRTWSNWLETHLDRKKTRIFFTSPSPGHREGGDWGKTTGENCYNVTEPIVEERPWGKGSDFDLMRATESMVEDLEKKGFNIKLLNITHLSQYRKDGHLSIYKRHLVSPTKLELANPAPYADCVHWCLPGVPDVWSEILYAYIRYKI
ncbi:hypothetical protein L1987_12931 [Smallanthus sonchifolius]|uniref:Uncharacterized protein n=1 Tax=Smallanthus sonchifolius TaxID=185202 RepID=A0ACB9JG42_9ASTR|nr:hypothetical protein L1987_12931 [Smallanthus sonchifolius]